MNELLESKFTQDLMKGELPPMEITVSNKTMVVFTLCLLVVGATLIYTNKILK